MIAQAELSYDTPGNYSLVCTDTSITNMITSIANAGGTAKCYSFDNTRWGVSAKLNSDNTQNFSVDSTGVVTWDTADKPASNWATANTNCAATGGRLPSVEELVALSNAYGGTPSGFLSSWYWSGTIKPTDSTIAYGVRMSDGYVYISFSGSNNVRCVR